MGMGGGSLYWPGDDNDAVFRSELLERGEKGLGEASG